MAHEQLLDPKRISFYYVVDKLFNKDSLWSMYKAINKTDDEGKTLLDELSITEDERDIFLEFLSDAITEVFGKLLKYTKGITNAINYFGSYTPDGGSPADCCVVQILDNEPSYNANYLNTIDKLLEKCLRMYILEQWFAIKDLFDDAKRFHEQYNRGLNQLLRESMNLKKLTISDV